MKKTTYLIIAGLLLNSAMAANIKYKLFSPERGAKIYKDKVLVKTLAKGARKAYVNGKLVWVKNNRIYKVITLDKPGEHVIKITLFAKDGSKKTDQVKIYKIGPAPVEEPIIEETPEIDTSQEIQEPELSEEEQVYMEYLAAQNQKEEKSEQKVTDQIKEKPQKEKTDTPEKTEQLFVFSSEVINLKEQNNMWNINTISTSANYKLSEESNFKYDVSFINNNYSDTDFELKKLFTKDIDTLDINFKKFMFDYKINTNIKAEAGANSINPGYSMFSPLNIVTPYDYTNMINFGKPRSNFMFNGIYQDKDFKISAIWQPVFSASKYITAETYYDYQQALAEIGYTNITTYTEHITKPKSSLANGTYSLVMSKKAFDTDFNFVYNNGYDTIPQLKNVELITVATPDIEIETEHIYPLTQTIGTNIKKSFGDINTWAEIAYNMPEKLEYNVNGDTTSLIEDAYTRYSFGLNAKLPNRFKSDIQYIYGLPGQRSNNTMTSLIDISFTKKDKDFTASIALGLESDEEIIGSYIKPEISFEIEEFKIGIGNISIKGEDRSYCKNMINNNQNQTYFKLETLF